MTKIKNDVELKETIQVLLKAKNDYYNGTPTMTDEEFDFLEDGVKAYDPNNPYFQNVGAPVNYGKKIKHLFPMLSMGKAKNMDEIVKWRQKINGENYEYIIEPKIDGLSSSLIYIEGKLEWVVTRGDGEIGQDITHLKDYLNVPKVLVIDNPPQRIEVRGELYLPKNTSFPNPENKPLRNICSGLVNRKSDIKDLFFVHFVAYQLIFDSNIKDYYNSESELILWMKMKGFDVVETFIAKSISDISSYYKRYLEDFRDAWNYETDGLIICVNDLSLHKEINSKYVVDHHNHYNIAFKPPSVSATTQLLDIEWQVSRTGNLIPVGILKPVIIGGAQIQRVTLNNFENVKNLDLFKANKIEVSRSNDVIPFFKAVVSKHDVEKIGIPTICPSCGTPLKRIGVHITCTNNWCYEQNIQRLVYWVKKSEIDGFAESTIRTLYEARIIRNIIDIYRFAEDQNKINKVKSFSGFGDKKVDSIVSEIKRTSIMSTEDFIERLGINLVGRKAVKKMGIITMKDFIDFNDNTYAIGQNLIEYRDNNHDYIQGILNKIVIKNPENKTLKGSVCMTGKGHKGRKELIKDIESLGYDFSDSISGDVKYLICEDVNGSSSKLQKARKLNIELISYKDFFKGL